MTTFRTPISIVLVAIACLAHRAHAQTDEGYASYIASKVVVQHIEIAKTSAQETEVRVIFSGGLAATDVLSNDAQKVSLAIEASAPMSVAVPNLPATGCVSDLSVQQGLGRIVLTATGTGTLHLTQRTEGSVLILTFTGTACTVEAAPAPSAATGTPAHHATRDSDAFEIVPLNYADVSEVVGLLTDNLGFKRNDYFNPQEPAFGSPNTMGQNAYSGPNNQSLGNMSDSSYGEKGDDVIGVDRRLNAIILQGPPDLVATLKKKIAKLDVPVRSVALETIFVELDNTAAKSLGIDLSSSSGKLATVVYTGAIGSNPTGYTTTGGELSLQAAVEAQVQDGHGKIISKPRISAQSGSTAKIVTGDAIPILTSIALSGVNAVSQQVQYVNVGVTLQIAPRISSDGFISSHIFCEVSSVTGTVQGYPTISQREAITSATVKDGQAFIIGGLMQDADISATASIPGVSSIPILGWLGKSKTGSSRKTDLYIVVIPHIIDANVPLPPLVRGNSGEYLPDDGGSSR